MCVSVWIRNGQRESRPYPTPSNIEVLLLTPPLASVRDHTAGLAGYAACGIPAHHAEMAHGEARACPTQDS
jgi:hypothetical protein